MAKNINDIKETDLGSLDELKGSTELTIEEKASLDATLFDGLPNEEEINSGEDVHYDSEELRKLFNDYDYDLDAELENFEDLEDIGMVILNCEDDTEHEPCDGCDGNCGCHSNDLGFEFDSLDDLD